MFLPVIMAGGSGSRLWPLSRSSFPKQFLALDGKNSHTMLQATLDRIEGMNSLDAIIISNEEHRFIVAEQVRSYGAKAEIILEPVGRNTAPAIALAAIQSLKNGQDPILLVLAADHVIQDTSAFQRSVLKAMHEAEKGNLVTFGIVPTSAEIGYGYIQRGENVSEGAYAVKRFVEKPELKLATEYFAGGEHYWNSGCFMFKASVYIEELKRFSTEIFSVCQKASENIKNDTDFFRVDENEFIKCPDNSIDYAVMEHTDKAIVVPLDAGWSDVGSWSALWDISEKDSNGNVHQGDTILKETRNCYIYAPNKLVTTVGLENIVVIETKDAVLVADKDKVQEVKKIVQQLKMNNRSEFKEHRESYKPWGKSDAIDSGDRYKVNRITILPGESRPLQVHYHRAEHWVVVSGTAKVTKDNSIHIVTENQSIYMPVGVSHMIENPGFIPLELIEIQSGIYLQENDGINIE
ncbi:mannose-1-phosphate guanylyltransferase/mannose-6-phosphate isomerase [Vibrio sp. MA40-2]|uniref:mannose-1-phosphate guanylyltransferase/mannose-6-phosphate isomerase n=1 Tax=Vibrio sp. MA40-2 TaxID=3391828 RepID=UPI0039A6138A